MEDVKTFLKDLEPMIKNVGSWDNVRISRAIVTVGYRNTILEDIHTNGTLITDAVRKEIIDGLVMAMNMAYNMQPLIEMELDDIEECILNLPEDVNEWIVTYLKEMLFADACSSQWDAPSEVEEEIFEELDDELCELDSDDWPEVIADFVLAGKFTYNQENNVVLTDAVMADMNRDVHNRMFTVLERLNDCLYGYV
jgi:hypothetical protein